MASPVRSASSLDMQDSFASASLNQRRVSAFSSAASRRDLSPTSNLRNVLSNPSPAQLHDLSKDSELIFQRFQSASPSDKAFAKHVLGASSALRDWSDELSKWPWDGTFDYLDDIAVETSTLDTDRENERRSFSSNLTKYRQRLEDVVAEFEDLDIEDMKNIVLGNCRSGKKPEFANLQSTSPSHSAQLGHVDNFMSLVTVVLLQTLPHHSNVSILIETWRARIAVLELVPKFKSLLREASGSLIEAWAAIGISREQESNLPHARLSASEEDIDQIRTIVQARVSAAGQTLDSMLDLLEGLADSLPDSWVDEVELLEEEYSEWSVTAYKILLEWQEQERAELERLKQERIEKERIEQERIEQERLEQERLEQERLEQERLERERLECEELENERLEQQKLEIEKLEQEKLGSEEEQQRIHLEKAEQESAQSESFEFREVQEQNLAEQNQIEGAQERVERELPNSNDIRSSTANDGIPLDRPIEHDIFPRLETPNGEEEIQKRGPDEWQPTPIKQRAEETRIENLRTSLIGQQDTSGDSFTSSMSIPATDSIETDDGSQSKTNASHTNPDLSNSNHLNVLKILGNLRAQTPDYTTTDESSPLEGQTSFLESGSESPVTAEEDMQQIKDPMAAMHKANTVKNGKDMPLSTDEQLERQIDSILTSLPGQIKLKKRDPQAGHLPYDRPASPSLTLAPAEVKGTRAAKFSGDSPIRLYYLSQEGRQQPIKLFVRLVGENGERVMVRVGGGWADLAQYLHEYATHHSRTIVPAPNQELQALDLRQPSNSRVFSLPLSTRDHRSPSPAPFDSPTAEKSPHHSPDQTQKTSRAPGVTLQVLRNRPIAKPLLSSNSAEDAQSANFPDLEEHLTAEEVPSTRESPKTGLEEANWSSGMFVQTKKSKANKHSKRTSSGSSSTLGHFEDLGTAGNTRRVFRISESSARSD